ncbi:MAG: hypothetical protein H7175_01620 [Burkholderiales bacterium]|nr:hypothetical protein [Anaerolineae bacterium]
MKRLLSILRLLSFIVIGLLLSLHNPPPYTVVAQIALPTSPPGALTGSGDSYIRAPRLGITFISSTGTPPVQRESRYRQALLLGAGWNRWPLYWNEVERAPGQFDWSGYDRLVSDDVAHGLQSNAILMGRPEFFHEGASIQGLFAPVFGDGTDTLAAGKTINSANPWANFVFTAVTRYKPGGTLAQQSQWLPGRGINVWEAWNEPDFDLFWQAGATDYARLLKVTYLAAHTADPNTRVMFGGLAYGNPALNDLLGDVLRIFGQDPQRTANNWYMDMVAVHNYSHAARSAAMIAQIERDLAVYGLTRPIWLNETGVPVWDDYPGPVWAANDPSQRLLRATEEQQAAYVVQSAALAWAEGADVVMFHQLFDDCGNQPSGTNFPPHNGELCTGGALCAGDAHGFFRNERSAGCFSQHPLPGSPRPAARAFRMVAEVFGSAPFSNGAVNSVSNSATVVSFNRQTTGQTIVVMWNRTLQRVVLDLPAIGSAEMFDMNNEDYSLAPTQGRFEIGLPAATSDDYPFLAPGEAAGIGGPPLVLIARTGDITLSPAEVQQITPEAQPAIRVSPTPGALQLIRPTLDPALDTRSPRTEMIALPATSAPTFGIAWSAEDESGIESYTVWVRVNGGEWQPWLETDHTEAQYTGTSGNSYEFAVWAVDLAGNWSPNTVLVPQAVTRVE